MDNIIMISLALSGLSGLAIGIAMAFFAYNELTDNRPDYVAFWMGLTVSIFFLSVSAGALGLLYQIVTVM